MVAKQLRTQTVLADCVTKTESRRSLQELQNKENLTILWLRDLHPSPQSGFGDTPSAPWRRRMEFGTRPE
jgi:hypothetical protein